jgi:hypothetical protein
MFPPTIALIMRINEITGEQSRLETELTKLSRELSGRPVKQQLASDHQNQDQHQDLVDIIDNSVLSSSVAMIADNKKRSRGRPRKDIGTVVSSSNINNIDKHYDETLRTNCDRDSGITITMNGVGDTDDGAYYFVDCGRVFVCKSGGMLFDMKTHELVGWRNTYLNRVDFIDIL